MSYDCEIPEFYSESFPIARKQHRCIECHAPIVVGEKHLSYRMKYDGMFESGRQHMVCRELCMLIRHNSECIPFGGLKEEWSNGDYMYDKVGFVAERRLMAKIVRRERVAGRAR